MINADEVFTFYIVRDIAYLLIIVWFLVCAGNCCGCEEDDDDSSQTNPLNQTRITDYYETNQDM